MAENTEIAKEQQEQQDFSAAEALLIPIIGKWRLNTAKKYIIERKKYENYASKRVYSLIYSLLRYLIHIAYKKSGHSFYKFLEEVTLNGTKSIFSKNKEVLKRTETLKNELLNTLVAYSLYAINTQHSRSWDDDARYREYLTEKPTEYFNEDDIQYSVERYTDRLLREAEVLVLCGLQTGRTENGLLTEWSIGAESSFETDFVKDNFKKSRKIEERWEVHQKTFKSHTAKSASRGLATLVTYLLSKIWMQYLLYRNTTTFFYVSRGSSYPCELCQSHVGIHRYADELPPYHRNCCCIAVPVYRDEYSQLI